MIQNEVFNQSKSMNLYSEELSVWILTSELVLLVASSDMSVFGFIKPSCLAHSAF